MMVPLLDADTNFTGVNQHCHEISAHLPLSNVKYSSCLPAHSVPNGGSPTSRGRGMMDNKDSGKCSANGQLTQDSSIKDFDL